MIGLVVVGCVVSDDVLFLRWNNCWHTGFWVLVFWSSCCNLGAVAAFVDQVSMGFPEMQEPHKLSNTMFDVPDIVDSQTLSHKVTIKRCVFKLDIFRFRSVVAVGGNICSRTHGWIVLLQDQMRNSYSFALWQA